MATRSMTPLRSLHTALLLGAALLLGSACGTSTIEEGRQFAGQRCFDDADCAGELVCNSDRICVPAGGRAVSPSDMTNNVTAGDMGEDFGPVNNTTGPVNNVSNNTTGDNNATSNNDTGANNTIGPVNNIPACEEGARFCVDGLSYDVCQATDDGGFAFERRDCPDGSRCEDGRCVDFCIDRDNDGAFGNCDPLDCDDRNPDRSPLNMEVCGDGLDNDCDRRTDEDCQIGCCEDGCLDNTFCERCACVMYDPTVCTQTNQPCTELNTQANGLLCADLTGNGQGVCIALCSLNNPDPDATCPEPGQQCVLGDDTGADAVGICLDQCNKGDNCGSPTLGCLLLNDPSIPSEGVCAPANPNNTTGSTCSPDVDGFLGCEGGSVCFAANQAPNSQGQCTESCRPFLGSGNQSDCPAGSYCLSLDSQLGICQPDTGLVEGDRCAQSQLLESCGADNVTCYPSQVGRPQCQRTCRLGQGNADCPMGEFCRSSGQNNSVGVCRPQ